MKKDFLDELTEALEKLHEERKVSGLNPDLGRGRTMAAFLDVCKNHKFTIEEKNAFAAAIMALDGITPEEAETLNNLGKN